MQVRWAGDRCSVCDNDVDWESDQLISCDQCGITVHQSCYGVPDAPGVDDMWLCRPCELKVGMLLRTDGSVWGRRDRVGSDGETETERPRGEG